MTNPPDNPHESLLGSISDGDRIDWDQAETAPGADAAMVRALRDVDRIARFSSQTQAAPFVGGPFSTTPTSHPQRWANLTLLELAGAGTRGEVWRAWDPTLQRQVALKFLQSVDTANGAEAREALLHEARALARVHHPNVATVFGIAEHDGRAGMWMEFLGGSTLAMEIERTGAIAPREVARIGVALCSALEALESASLVHRDIKPANIALQPDGRVVLMDFGLGQRFATPGESRSSGTPVFMAPEVLASGPATHRSDLYALGVTLWWAAAGRPPFEATSLEELKEQVARGPTTTLRQASPAVPRKLAAAIEWAMSREPEARPGSAAQFRATLRSLLSELGDSGRRKRWIRAVAISAAGIAASMGIGLMVAGRLGPFAGSPPSLAVLPMVNRTGNPADEYVADGMTDELIARFAQIGNLRVTSYPSVATFKNSKLPMNEIAEKLHATMLVETSVSEVGEQLHVSATLVDASDARAVWGQVYEGPGNDVYALEGELVSSVANRLAVLVSAGERTRLRRGREANPTARTLYLHGLDAYHDGSSAGTQRAIDLFHRAIAMDSTYADPWTRLAYAYDWATSSTYADTAYARLADMAARRAVQLDPESGPARAILTTHNLYHSWDFVTAIHDYRQALTLSPGDVDARAELVICLSAMGRFQEAIAEAKRARESDALSSYAAETSIYPLFEGRKFAEAVRTAKEILDGDPNNADIAFNLGQAQYFAGFRREGIATLEQVVRKDPFPEAVAWLGLLRGLSGDEEGARASLARLEGMNREHPIDPYCLAIAHLGLGEKDAALGELRLGSDYAGSVIFIRVDPALDSLRQDPRFQALEKRFRIS